MRWETDLPPAKMVYGRQEAVVERCRGRRVLHLGCVDAGLLEQRLQAGQLMHQKLAAVAADLWGLDIDEAGIERMREHGFQQLIAADAAEAVPQLEAQSFDVIVASEVVEHLMDPGRFLQSVRSWMTPGSTELIVTVPNAFRIDTLLGLFRGVERIHPDHNYWFSYRTATNLLHKTGFEITSVSVYSLQPRGILPEVLRRRRVSQAPAASADAAALPPLLWRGWDYLRSLPKRFLVTALYATNPFWGDGLILTARRPE